VIAPLSRREALHQRALAGLPGAGDNQGRHGLLAFGEARPLTALSHIKVHSEPRAACCTSVSTVLLGLSLLLLVRPYRFGRRVLFYCELVRTTSPRTVGAGICAT
jgi:hypothetical protein